MARLAAELREENARLRAEHAEQAAELEKLRADLAVFQRMLFGQSSERSRPGSGGAASGGDGEQDGDRGSGRAGKRGPGARAGRRDYSHLPRVEVSWDFPGGGYCCPECGEPFAAGRGQNSLVKGLARQGAEISPATLAGTCAQAGALLVPAAEAVTERSRDSWHLHADETTWRVFAPRDGDGPAKWWLRVFIGPDTVCFVMDPTRSGAVLARHAGIDEKTGQLTGGGDGGPRRLVISSDFYAVYQSAGKKADGLVNLFCWAQYAEPGIMRNSTAVVARVACRGGDRADAGRGKFRIITGSLGRRGRGQAGDTVRALCWAGSSGRVPVLSAEGLRAGRSGPSAGPRGPAIVRWWPGQPRCEAGSSRRCGEGYERRFSWRRARGSPPPLSARA